MGKIRQALPVQFQSRKNFKQWIRNILVGVDQLVGAVVLATDPDETISSVIGKHARDARLRRLYCRQRADGFWLWAERVVDYLLGKGHCMREIEPDEGKEGLL